MNEKEKLEKIKNDLTLDQIEALLTHLGGEPIRQEEIIISRTVCHGGDSHKLYYYNNTKLFKCFTQCEEESFDIFQLIIKTQKDYTLPQALKYITSFFNIIVEDTQEGFIFLDSLEDWEIFKRYEGAAAPKEKKIIEFKTFEDNFLRNLPRPSIIPWLEEGISKEVCQNYGICYNPSSQAIVIPHYDQNGLLIGVRERTLIKENEEFGKYRPMYLNRQLFNHPLGFALYNLNNSKDNIKKVKKAIVFEGEKSCLKYASYFGEENDISVAVCGSAFTIHQFNLLSELGVEEIIIAFDKQFQIIGDEEWKAWTKKLKQIHQRFGGKVQISFMFDKWGLLGYKDSPIDKDKETFLELFKCRIALGQD